MYLVQISYCTELDQQKRYVQLLYKFKWFIKNFTFYQEPQQTSHTKQKNSKIYARSLRSRHLGVISALNFININIDLGISKTMKSNKQTHQN